IAARHDDPRVKGGLCQRAAGAEIGIDGRMRLVGVRYQDLAELGLEVQKRRGRSGKVDAARTLKPSALAVAGRQPREPQAAVIAEKLEVDCGQLGTIVLAGIAAIGNSNAACRFG